MIIQQTGLLDLLNAQVQYRIPIYQRKYDWEKDDCLRLLNDIIDIAQDNQRDQHFVGSVIYKSENGAATVGAVNVNFLIDGQQRLTTLMLILWATGHYAKEVMNDATYAASDYNLEAIKEDYLTNNKRHSATDKFYRLKPIGNDEIAYKALMNDDPIPDHIGSSRIYDNYQIILTHLHRVGVSPDVILSGIRKLVIANISLEARDNAQLLFETVNSTGKELKAVDKVRNYILMNAGEVLQQQLYVNHWQPMEQRLNISVDGGKSLNNFFFYYAGIVTEDKTPADYYGVFKDHYLGINAAGIQTAVEDMDAYSVIYKRWLDSNATQTDTDLYLYRLKITNNDKCIPVVLKVLRNVALGVMSQADADEVLKILESYVIRREMYGLRSNAIGEAFVKILRAADSLANIKMCIVSELTDKQRMPNDGELKIALKTATFYGLRHDHEILDRIEKYLNPAYMPDHTKVSIEHIMPQTIEATSDLYARTDYSQKEKDDRDWAKDLGSDWKEIHEKYCNTLGNLTLTGYNPQLSNCRFLVKRDMSDAADDGVIYGYSTSAIRLSQGLRNVNKWGEAEILNRLDTIFKHIQAIWPYPNVPSAAATLVAKSSTYDDESSRQKTKSALFDTPDIDEVRKDRAYKKHDASEGYVLIASKMYPKGSEEKYWFGYRVDAFSAIDDCAERYCVLICRKDKLTVLKLPITLIETLKDRFNKSVDDSGNITHYHIDLRRNLNGKYSLLLSKPTIERFDVSDYVVASL